MTDAASPYPFDLGSFRRATSTWSADAQRSFDRGLVWSYAFNHEEAIRCFERAIAVDERFALAHWGLAYAQLKPQLDRALAVADVQIKSSCFCRMHHAHPSL